MEIFGEKYTQAEIEILELATITVYIAARAGETQLYDIFQDFENRGLFITDNSDPFMIAEITDKGYNVVQEINRKRDLN